MTDRSQLVAALVRWRMDAVAFVRECLDIEPDEWQEKALRVASKPEPLVRLAMVSAKGVGKSALLAMIGWWWFFTRNRAQIICTSITGKNLKDGLWKELISLMNRSPLLRSVAEVRSERIIMLESPNDWFISARSWAQDADKAAQESTLAGLHGDAMAYLADEVGEYPMGVLPAAEAMAANIGPGNECRIIVAGNPTNVNGPLYPIATTQRDRWNVINITSDPDDPLRSPRVSIEWAREQILIHGRDHPYTMVNVLGQFPKTALNTLLSPEEVRQSTLRQITELDYHWSDRRLGVDVAYTGSDKTVIAYRQGVKGGPFAELQGADPQEVAARVAVAMQRTKAEIVFVDADGIGAGVVAALKVAGIAYNAVRFAGKPNDPRYYNKRAEIWYEMAGWVKDRGQIPNKSELIADLTTPKYRMHKGKILIEEKDEIRKRRGASTDYGDALACTFALPDAPHVDKLTSLAMYQNQGNGNSRNWDPISGKLPAEKGGAEYDPMSRF